MEAKRTVRSIQSIPIADGPARDDDPWHDRYQRACETAVAGNYIQARQLFEELGKQAHCAEGKARVENDLAVLDASAGHISEASARFLAALEKSPQLELARRNSNVLSRVSCGDETARAAMSRKLGTTPDNNTSRSARIAICSLLFNWPARGGGVYHTVGLAKALMQAGYEVQHFHAVYTPWAIGRVEGELPIPAIPLEFDESAWNLTGIQRRFRSAIDDFEPDFVLITGSWNFKPRLAEAVKDYPFILRFGAQECLCPLNNIRLLASQDGGFVQCHKHQLATPEDCYRCVQLRSGQSGQLHQAERRLSGVGTAKYDRVLRWALAEAHAVLVVNPLIEAMLGPYARRIQVVPSGFDPERFPWPDGPSAQRDEKHLRIFMGGMPSEPMKGFRVLHEACRTLWQTRHDFELCVTGEPEGKVDEFTRFLGWLSQAELPRHLRAADIVAFPTIAQEALGRTAVEAMGCGKPVVASRIGGLPYTILDGATGLLCEPGNPADLARKIGILLDDGDLRRRMGLEGRRRFEREFRWDVLIDRFYRPLFQTRIPAAATRGAGKPCTSTRSP